MKYLILIAGIFISGNSFSQKEMVIKSKVSEGKIQLRWTPVNSVLFKQAMSSGFIIQRKELKPGESSTSINWNSGLDFEQKISPLQKEDSLWKKLFQEFSEAAIVYSFLYPEKPMERTKEENLFGLTLLACDINPELAKKTGLYFKDSLIEKGKKYVYRILISDLNKSQIIEVDSKEITRLPQILEFNLKNGNKSSELSWNFRKYQSYYSGYVLERSEDSLHYFPLMDKPFIPMASQFEKDKEITFMTDTGVRENKTYWYRISGRDHFGEVGPVSLAIELRVISFFEGEIIIDTLFESGTNEAVLKWHFSQPSDQARISSLQISRSATIEGEYEVIDKPEKHIRELKLSLLNRENYIKVTAYNQENKMETWPELILMPDQIPPTVPDSLLGKIDRNGKVVLHWKKNIDADLKGYRVFKTNAMHEEFVEITNQLLTDNSFIDSVNIQSLTEEVYYSVNAVDLNYNNSQLSVPVKLEKPDIIPPTSSPIVKTEVTSLGNYLEWIPSESKDLRAIEIRRSENGKLFEKIFSLNNSDTVSGFVDSSLMAGQGYYYRTVSIDDANNFTESESVYLLNPIIAVKVKDSIKVTVDRNEKFIRLDWEPLKEDVYSYTVYKAKKGEMLRSFKTVSSKISEITDRELYISNEYVYSVKAMLNSGREVMLVKELVVIY